MTAFFGFPRDGHAYSADEVGAALAGLIRRDSNGLPVEGVLGALTVSAVPTSWKVEVSPFTYIAAVGSGVQITGLSAAEQVDITPATGIPAGQGRIDLVCWDAINDALTVVEGTVSATPSAPVVSGIAPLARVRVNSGDGMVIASQVSHVFGSTSLAAGKQSGVVSHPAGGVGLSNPIFRSTNNFQVTFETPFMDVPKLKVTGIAGGGMVAQWVQVFSLTREGFSWRVISAVAPPQAGSMHWEAEPQ